MTGTNEKSGFRIGRFFSHDLKASITIFFVALPLCLGISLASGAPVYAGLIAGMVGGMVVSLISTSPLSVSGPAAGLTAICAAAIVELKSLEVFFLAVALAGIFQVILGAARLGGFTRFIPSAVIKGMLAAIGIILISKQIPLLVGYDKPDFWTNQLFNIFTLENGFENINGFFKSLSLGAFIIAAIALGLLIIWKKWIAHHISYLPTSFIVVVAGVLVALLFKYYVPQLALRPSQFVNVPGQIFDHIKLPDVSLVFGNSAIWSTAIIIGVVASLETLLSVEAIDKIDPYNRVTSQNRELMAQGTGNFVSGMLGGIPITSVIVRSSANAEAGAKTKVSAFLHGLWLLLIVVFASDIVNLIPYSVLAVILIRTGYNLAKPVMIMSVYKQGREQFLPFIVTVGAILFTDLLIGVLIGTIFSVYFIIKHTYRAGYSVSEKEEGHTKHYRIELALNVSFLNKNRFVNLLDQIPAYAVVEIIGTHSVYIDYDVLEIFEDFKNKAHNKHIQLTLVDIPPVEKTNFH